MSLSVPDQGAIATLLTRVILHRHDMWKMLERPRLLERLERLFRLQPEAA